MLSIKDMRNTTCCQAATVNYVQQVIWFKLSIFKVQFLLYRISDFSLLNSFGAECNLVECLYNGFGQTFIIWKTEKLGEVRSDKMNQICDELQ